MKLLQKNFWIISAFAVFGFGTVLTLSYGLSDKAAWSILVSCIRETPWEYIKPFAIVYIFWVFIELSYIRPSLLRFVCAKILFLHFFVLISFLMLKYIPFTEIKYYIIFAVLLVSQYLSYKLYMSGKRCDCFFVPLIISFAILFFMLLIFSVHPPKWIL